MVVVKEEKAPPEIEEKLTIAYWHSKTESVYVFLRHLFFFGLPARIHFLPECSSGTWSSVAHDGMCGSRYNVARCIVVVLVPFLYDHLCTH